MDQLPNDLIIIIFIHIGFPNNLGQTNMHFNNLSNGKYIWHTLLNINYPQIKHIFNNPKSVYITLSKISNIFNIPDGAEHGSALSKNDFNETLAGLNALKIQCAKDNNLELLQYIINTYSDKICLFTKYALYLKSGLLILWAALDNCSYDVVDYLFAHIPKDVKEAHIHDINEALTHHKSPNKYCI